MAHLGVCPKLPKQMKVNVCVMDDLPCYVEGHTADCNDDEIDYDEEKINEDVRPSTDGIKGDVYSFDKPSTHELSSYKESNDSEQESDYLADSPKPGVVDDTTASSKVPSSCSEQHSGCLQESGGNSSRQLSPRLSPQGTRRYPSKCEEEQSPSFRWLQESDLKRQSSPLGYSHNKVPVGSPIISPLAGAKRWSFCAADDQSCSSFADPPGTDRLRQETDSLLLLSDEGDIIDLSTPSSCIVRKCNNRAKVCSQVIDLTDSPIIIQL